jgi:hypothetical protein
MPCEICGRSGCIKSFHSIEEQEIFDNIKDKVINDMKNKLIKLMSSELLGHCHGDNYYVRLDKVIKLIDKFE